MNAYSQAEPSKPVELDAVVFDLGGVLVDWNPRYLYDKVIADPVEREAFLANVCSLTWNAQQDAGRPWADAIAELARLHPAEAERIAMYRSRWHEMLGGVIEDSVALLARLKDAGTRLYALTNWSQETFPIAQERYGFLSWFDGIVVSGEEGLIKPDRAIYALLCTRYGLDPSRAVFIDDSRANVEVARQFGLHGLHFTGAAKLQDDLCRFTLRAKQARA